MAQRPGESFDEYAARLERENELFRKLILSALDSSADDFLWRTLMFIANTIHTTKEWGPLKSASGSKLK